MLSQSQGRRRKAFRAFCGRSSWVGLKIDSEKRRENKLKGEEIGGKDEKIRTERKGEELLDFKQV